ncbi:MAG: TraB/GumN family protein [Planctomycetota bacterium]|jgi:uncharacterized protein YbaP (TraB family)
MKRLFLLSLLLVACENERGGRYLWKATGELGTAYLMGTIHIPATEVLELSPGVWDAIGRSDVVLTELTFDRETAAKVQKKMLLPKGQTLKKIIPKETYDRIAKKVPIAGMNDQQVWAATMNLVLLHGRHHFMGGRQPMDLLIPAKAKEMGKETGALETPEEQLAVLSSQPLEDQIKGLEAVADLIAKDRANGTNMIDEMVKLYVAGDLKKLMEWTAKFSGLPSEADKKLLKKLIDDRNKTMADRLVERMGKRKGKTWFVAVGAAHHYGEVGIPKLLEKRGFKVTRLKKSSG